MERILEPELMDTAEDATAYDSMAHRAVNQQFARDFFTFVDSVLQDVDQWSVLDVGTGTARLPIEMCRLRPDTRVLAIDDAVSMLELARYNVEVASLQEQIALAKADAKKMPYDEEAFPFVIANSVHHHLPDPLDSFREMVRVTEDEGILFVRDLARPDSAADVDRLVRQHARDENPQSQRLFADSLRAALRCEEVADIVESLGFDRRSVTMTSDRHWTWAALKEKNVEKNVEQSKGENA